jgi:hypothetical protein
VPLTLPILRLTSLVLKLSPQVVFQDKSSCGLWVSMDTEVLALVSLIHSCQPPRWVLYDQCSQALRMPPVSGHIAAKYVDPDTVPALPTQDPQLLWIAPYLFLLWIVALMERYLKTASPLLVSTLSRLIHYLGVVDPASLTSKG